MPSSISQRTIAYYSIGRYSILQFDSSEAPEYYGVCAFSPFDELGERAGCGLCLGLLAERAAAGVFVRE